MPSPRAGVVEENGRPRRSDRRHWERLPLAIPIFVRGSDDQGKEFQEFTTALNISAGGLLIASRRYLPVSSRISLEIPSAPLPPARTGLQSIRNLSAHPVTVTHAEQCYLVGVKFSRPLSMSKARGSKRKSFSST